MTAQLSVEAVLDSNSYTVPSEFSFFDQDIVIELVYTSPIEVVTGIRHLVCVVFWSDHSLILPAESLYLTS